MQELDPGSVSISLSPEQRARIQALNADGFFRYAAPDPCFACGGEQFRTIARRDRYGFALRYVCCDACGFVFANPYYTAECLDTFYTSHYGLIYGRDADEAQLFNEFLRATDHILPFLTKHLPKAGAAMDFGCANGGALIALPGTWHSVGFDYDTDQITRGRRLGLDLREVHAFDSCQDQFDLIMMNQVLEHTHNPVELLKRVASRLKDDGILYIEVPGFAEVFSRGIDPRLPFKNAHRHLFCLDSLQRVARLAGLFLVEGDENVRAVFSRSASRSCKADPSKLTARAWVERLVCYTPPPRSPFIQFARKAANKLQRLAARRAFKRAVSIVASQTSPAASREHQA